MAVKIPTGISLIIAIIPALLLAWFYANKHKERHTGSTAFIIYLFFLGLFSVIPICGLEILTSELSIYFKFDPYLQALFHAFFIGGICEEYIKLAIIKVTVYNSPRFKKVIDGISYTIVAGLGFACIENIMYVVDNTWDVAISRAFTTVPMHAICSGILGYYIGESKFARSKRERKKIIQFGLWQVIAIHGLYNFLILISPLTGSLYAGFVFPLIILVYIVLKDKIQRAIAKDDIT